MYNTKYYVFYKIHSIQNTMYYTMYLKYYVIILCILKTTRREREGMHD